MPTELEELQDRLNDHGKIAFQHLFSALYAEIADANMDVQGDRDFLLNAFVRLLEGDEVCAAACIIPDTIFGVKLLLATNQNEQQSLHLRVLVNVYWKQISDYIVELLASVELWNEDNSTCLFTSEDPIARYDSRDDNFHVHYGPNKPLEIPLNIRLLSHFNSDSLTFTFTNLFEDQQLSREWKENARALQREVRSEIEPTLVWNTVISCGPLESIGSIMVRLLVILSWASFPNLLQRCGRYFVEELHKLYLSELSFLLYRVLIRSFHRLDLKPHLNIDKEPTQGTEEVKRMSEKLVYTFNTNANGMRVSDCAFLSRQQVDEFLNEQLAGDLRNQAMFPTYFTYLKKRKMRRVRKTIRNHFINLSWIHTSMFDQEPLLQQLTTQLRKRADVHQQAKDLVEVLDSSGRNNDIHAEMKVLSALQDKECSPLGGSVGISKGPCKLCEYSMVHLFGDEQKRNLHVPPPSKNLFPRWTIPNRMSWEQFFGPVYSQWTYFLEHARLLQPDDNFGNLYDLIKYLVSNLGHMNERLITGDKLMDSRSMEQLLRIE